MTQREASLVKAARLMGLSVGETVVLPAVIERAALMVEMPEAVFLDRLFFNGPLRDYVAQVCRKVAATSTVSLAS